VDDCHFSYITNFFLKTHTHTHTHRAHLWWWLLLLLLLVGFRKFEKHSISKTYLYWIHYCISSWETMLLAFGLWHLGEDEERRSQIQGPHKVWAFFLYGFFVCVCVQVFLTFSFTYFTFLLSWLVFLLYCFVVSLSMFFLMRLFNFLSTIFKI
jgi:hypothetical protein